MNIYEIFVQEKLYAVTLKPERAEVYGQDPRFEVVDAFIAVLTENQADHLFTDEYLAYIG